ncbi:hypothetical protein LINPERPRIM_LOCUS7168 [Linum perenne]
MKKVMIVVPSG